MAKKTYAIYWIIMAFGLLALTYHIFFKDDVSKVFITLLPPVGAGFHALNYLGRKNALKFFLISAFTGFIFEYLGLTFGVPFGGEYVYTEKVFAIMGVPISVILFWFVFIYTAHCIADLTPPSTRPRIIENIDRSLKTGFLVVLIDLVLDPIMVVDGQWIWTSGGLYFGIPIGNFAGWVLVGFIGDMLYRSTQRAPYSFPKIKEVLPAVVTYNLMIVSFALLALLKGIKEVAVIGFFIFSLTLFISIHILTQSFKKDLP